MNDLNFAKKNNVQIIDKGNGHIQLKGKLLVNYYPESKFKTAYISGMKNSRKKAELDRLRAEAAERDQKEAARLAIEEERKFQEEKTAKEEKRIKDEAEASARAAVDAANRDKQEAIEAKERAELEAKNAEERAFKEIEEKQHKEQEELAAREADTKHRGKINREAVKALELAGIDSAIAKNVITVIAKGMIPNVKINY